MSSANIEIIVRRWLALSMLTSRYSSAPESTFDYDVKRFDEADDPFAYVNLKEAEVLSDAFWHITLPERLKTSVASSPLFNVYLMAQVKAGDKGFLSDEIDVKAMLEHRGDIHHLFPKQYLIDNGIKEKTRYNQIANYAYLQSDINIKIKDTAPNVYMAKILQQCEDKNLIYGGIKEKTELMENLKANCIPEDFCKMTVADYEKFLDIRRSLMADKIHEYYLKLK